MPTVPEALEIALQHLRAGRLQEAEAICREILQVALENPDALHLLGVIVHQAHQHTDAEQYLLRAIALRPEAAEFHASLGAVYEALAKLGPAEACYRRAVELDPQVAIAHFRLGQILRRQRKLDEAIACYQRALRIRSEFFDCHLNLGLAWKDQGRLAEAIECWRQAVRLKPNEAGVYNFLGVASAMQGSLDESEQFYRQATLLQPDYALPYFNLGNLLKRMKRFDEAIGCYQRVLQLEPDDAAAQLNLGDAWRAMGRLDEAIACFRHCLRLRSDDVPAHINLGGILSDLGFATDAIGFCRQATELEPQNFEAHISLGSAFQQAGSLDKAIRCFERALELSPDSSAACNNLGIALQAQGRLPEAQASFQQALRCQPDFAKAHSNLGMVLQLQGKLEEAMASFREAVRLEPDHAKAHNNLGIVLQMQGKLAEAVASYHEALRLEPDNAEVHCNLGIALRMQGKLEEAMASFHEALRLKPDHVETHTSQAGTLIEQGCLEEAVTSLHQAQRLSELQLHPQAARFHSNLVFVLPFHPGYDARAICQECQRWNQLHAESLHPLSSLPTNDPDPERRLKIGYVSPDFSQHIQSFFTIPLLANHDHRQVEVFCYADVACPDTATERLRGYTDVWRSTVGLSDQQIADMVRSDQIDILIDLTMHMANNRLLVFARKPAPVQVSWLAYPGTTGLSTIDYRLTDSYLDPPELGETCYTEETIRLPDTFWCYDPRTDEPPVNPLPALENGFLTFGSLNNFCKINDAVMELWANVLLAVPHSRLLLLCPRGRARDRALSVLERKGVAANRVEIVDKRPRPEYLAMYHKIDVALDPLPANGHTTSLDAFWMGVPVITLVGKTVLGRAGWSQLCNLGLTELAAQTPKQYLEIAVRLADDLVRLQELRGTLRQRMLRSPLMDGNRFARNMEQAFRQMWRRWCQEATSGTVKSRS